MNQPTQPPAQQPSWFKTGFDTAERVASSQQARRNDNIRYNLRFDRKTNKGEEATVVFLDPPTEKDIVLFWEHEYDTLDGAWYNHTLCPQGQAPCLMCERKVQPYFAGALSIIRISPTTDSQGNQYVNQKQLLVAKSESLQRLRRMFQQRSGLVGTVWSVFRTGVRAAKIGDDWQFQRKIEGGLPAIAADLKLTPEQVQPFNYAEVLALKSREQLMAEPIDWNRTVNKKDMWKDGAGGRSGGGFPPSGGAPPGATGRSTEVNYK